MGAGRNLWTTALIKLSLSLSLSPPLRVAALGLFAGVVLVLLLFCLYRVLCPRNYGQNGVPHGRRRRGDLPCDEYGYSPPISEISPLLLRGHSMVGTHTRQPPPNSILMALIKWLFHQIACRMPRC